MYKNIHHLYNKYTVCMKTNNIQGEKEKNRNRKETQRKALKTEGKKRRNTKKNVKWNAQKKVQRHGRKPEENLATNSGKPAKKQHINSCYSVWMARYPLLQAIRNSNWYV